MMQHNTTKKGQLCKWERAIIEHLWKNGKGQTYREIGEVLKRDHSVIGREILRNGEDKGKYLVLILLGRVFGAFCLKMSRRTLKK